MLFCCILYCNLFSCVFRVLFSGCSSDTLTMSLSETSKLTCLEGWRDCLKLDRVAESQPKKNTPPPPPSKFNVQIAQISMCFWQHPPHYISLTLPRNWQSILGILCSERAGTVPTSDSEAQIKEWCETLLINCSFPAPWRTGMQTAEPTYLRKSLNGHAKRFLVC